MIDYPYIVTTARDGSTKVHRPTCKKALANAGGYDRTADYTAGTAASCCKPKALAAAPAKKVPAKKAAAKARPKIDPNPVTSLAEKRQAKKATATEQASQVLYDAGPDRVKAAKAEHRALAAARKAGQPLPVTPNLDALNAENAAGRPAVKRERKPRARTEVTVRFMRGPTVDDLKPMPDSQNKLSSVAYYHTRGVTGWNAQDDDVPRCTTDMLRSILTDHHGVESPETQPWGPVLLPNGTWLAAEAL